jgi:mannose-6-phosphate isomerase-like protein (cupin superfamily)
VLGAAAVEARPAAETFFSAADVEAKFATGGLLFETPRYALDAGRREAPGAVELHESTTDIMVAVEGTATVVTDGTPHTLEAGDVLVIPHGVAHEFVEVSKPFLYFVVKVER